MQYWFSYISREDNPYMFFDQPDERKTIMQSIITFEKVGKSGLAGFRNLTLFVLKIIKN